MAILTVTARRQLTLPEALLQHLGIKPGEKIEIELLPNGRVELMALCAHSKPARREDT